MKTVYIDIDDWHDLYSEKTRLLQKKDEEFLKIKKQASDKNIVVIITLNGSPEYILTYDATADTFKEIPVISK